MNFKTGLAFLVICLTLTACQSRSADPTSSPALTPESLIARNSWCQVVTMSDDFQIVTRMNFSKRGENSEDSKLTFDYLRLSSNQETQTHLGSEGSLWKIQNDGDENLHLNKYTVELIESESKIQSLASHRQQKLIFEEILKNNQYVVTNTKPFSPSTAVVVRKSIYRLFSENSDFEIVGYPCESYSPTFLKKEPSRPMVEFNLFLNQSKWSDRHKYIDD